MLEINLLLPKRGDFVRIFCEEEATSDYLMEQIQPLISEEIYQQNWLCHIENRRLLIHNETLAQNGLINGSSLVMI